MKAILAFNRTKLARGIIGAVFAAVLTFVLFFLTLMTFNWIAGLSGASVPAWMPQTQTVLKTIVPILAGVYGFTSGLGIVFNKSSRFFYYAAGTALAWGLFGQAIGFVIGASIVALFGGEFLGEGGFALGAIISIIGFMIGSGVTSDWIQWMFGYEAPLHHGAPDGEPEWMRYFSVDVNHKVIGIQYAITGVIVLLVGGTLAIIFRLELAMPGLQLLTVGQYNTMFSAHGIIMIASILLGIGGMMNFLVPVMIGASDMAFPRLNAFSFWISIPSALLILIGMFVGGGWDTGWVGYPPLSSSFAPSGVILFLLGFYFNGFASIASAINVLTTVATMRAKGMSMWRVPIFIWTAIAASLIQFTATQTVGMSLTMVVAERVLGMGFFDATPLASGFPVGDPILYQHLFWFYSHPVVYVFILPGLGIVSELLPVFCRKPLFGYKWVAVSSLGIALLGFLVWAHHMFASGMGDSLRYVFMTSTMFVGIPT
ncbi:MAG TPA: hypothetical protein ENJ56_01500, partial [Anaerolineae bacterium]|nr:hypothetical protein [Anaerolineae bacterium]